MAEGPKKKKKKNLKATGKVWPLLIRVNSPSKEFKPKRMMWIFSWGLKTLIQVRKTKRPHQT